MSSLFHPLILCCSPCSLNYHRQPEVHVFLLIHLFLMVPCFLEQEPSYAGSVGPMTLSGLVGTLCYSERQQTTLEVHYESSQGTQTCPSVLVPYEKSRYPQSGFPRQILRENITQKMNITHSQHIQNISMKIQFYILTQRLKNICKSLMSSQNALFFL